MRVAFRVDGNPRIGGGHVMRCLTLADELRARGSDAIFVSAAVPPALAERITGSGHELRRIDAPDGLGRTGDDWHEPPLAAEAQQADVAATAAALGGASDWIVVDHYLLDSRWHDAVRQHAQRILVIDDLANRRLDCDVLVDQTAGRSLRDYAELVPDNATLLCGSVYALLRPEFAHERRAALERRRKIDTVHRILISLGTSDIGAITAEVLERILPLTRDCSIDVVISPDASSLSRVKQLAQTNSNIQLHIDSHDMAAPMRDSDLAIGAAGTTSWERCCLGLPSLTFVLAGNQAGVASALADVGASISVDPSDVADRLSELLQSPARLQSMSASAFALVDGEGTRRVADCITGSAAQPSATPVRLRPATDSDSEMLWLWRNDPVTRGVSRSTAPVIWAEHELWLHSVLADPQRTLLIAERKAEPVGMVRFDFDEDRQAYEVSINLRPDARGAGLGRKILDRACAQFAGHGSFPIVAAVHEDNRASRRLFESCGFTDAGRFGDDAFRRYVRNPSIPRSRRSA